jgi:hypothetical protein
MVKTTLLVVWEFRMTMEVDDGTTVEKICGGNKICSIGECDKLHDNTA